MEQVVSTSPARGACGAGCRVIAYAVPIVLLSALQITYLLWPRFYLSYVIELRRREHQVVEIITFISALTGGVLMFRAAWRLWRGGGRKGGGQANLLRDHGGLLMVAVIALATLFFAGEEISWGQTYVRWNTPESYKALSVETNLHNAPLRVKTLGDVFLVAMFFVLPALWVRREQLSLPTTWAPAVPEGPVVFGMAAAFVWKLYKNFYRAFLLDEDRDDVFYVQFVEQINEHKEMLAAVSLLMYGLYRMAAVRRFLDRQTGGGP